MSGSVGVSGEQSPETTRPGLLPLPHFVPGKGSPARHEAVTPLFRVSAAASQGDVKRALPGAEGGETTIIIFDARAIARKEGLRKK